MERLSFSGAGYIGNPLRISLKCMQIQKDNDYVFYSFTPESSMSNYFGADNDIARMVDVFTD